jgi:small subunit ribosomal protein S8
MNHLLSDMFTRLRNGQKAKKFSILIPQSKLSSQLLDIFYTEGFISGYKISPENPKMFEIVLKYYKKKPVINKIVSISKPSKKIYMSVADLWKLNTGLNLIILSTSKGIISDKVCRQLNVGGEVFCIIR